jgi:type IV pilus assembly protein PilP
MKTYSLPRFRNSNAVVALMLALGVSACSTDISDLRTFVDEAKKSQKAKVAPLPEIKPYETFRYAANHLRDPFEPFTPTQPTKTVKVGSKTGSGPKPIEGRAREALESYPLDVLRMVGILEQSNTMWALLKGSDGTIHRVQTGNYIGQNHGKILSISEDKISLTEIVPDGLGGWIERPASLALAGSPNEGK